MVIVAANVTEMHLLVSTVDGSQILLAYATNSLSISNIVVVAYHKWNLVSDIVLLVIID